MPVILLKLLTYLPALVTAVPQAMEVFNIIKGAIEEKRPLTDAERARVDELCAEAEAEYETLLAAAKERLGNP